jgi:hypothetical protein
MVRFLEDPEQYKTCEMIEHIDSSIHRYDFGLFKLSSTMFNAFPVLPDMTINKSHLKISNENMLPKKFFINYLMFNKCTE